MKTLKEFLKRNDFYGGLFSFAKNLTLEEFLSNCQNGIWIASLFQKTNPRLYRVHASVAGHCVNIVREKMKHKASLDAVDAAIKETARKRISDAEYVKILEAAFDASAEAVQAEVLKNEIIQKWLEGREVKKFIFVKGKMINVVV